MTDLRNFAISQLKATEARAVADFLRTQPLAYRRFFYALPTEESAITETLDCCNTDVYSGVFWNDALIGIFILRGWDDGYEIPSFGVLIDYKYRGGAIMRLTLDAAKLICRLSGTKKLMAKIHPDNISPKGARRLGLIQISVEGDTGNVVYHMDL